MAQAVVGSCLAMVLSLYDYNMDQYSNFIELLEVSGTDIPKQYISNTCPEYMEHETHDWLIQVTQNKFYARQKGERWNQKIPQWIADHPFKIIEEGKQLGVLSKTYPKNSSFECAAIFGSTAPNMECRIDDFKDRVENGEIKIDDKIVLLTGTRYVTVDKDGGKDYVQKIAKINGVAENEVTETMFMKDLYEKALLGTTKLKNIPFEAVDTPRAYPIFKNTADVIRTGLTIDEIKKLPRPNTITTIEKFVAELQPTECKSILYVSKAPYTISQAEDAKKIMYMRSPDRKFEVIGGGVKEEIKQVKPDSAAYHITMAIAGQLFGGFEIATMKINLKYNMCSSIAYLTYYKKMHFSKTHKVTSTKKLELPDTKIN